MQNTVIGVYDNYSQAKAAYDALTALGFEMTNIQLSPEQDGHEARSRTLTDRGESDQGFSLGKFFGSLFGTTEDQGMHHDAYHEAVRRGSYLVTVQTASDTLRDQACQVMERFDPVDIDERSSQWRTQGWSGHDRQSMAFTDDEVQRERSLYSSRSDTPSAASSALNRRVKVYGVDPALANTSNTVAATGATPGTSMAGTSITGSDVDEMSAYRNHWQDSYSGLGGRYEDYEPAYRFGSELRRNESYRAGAWNELEPEFKRDWEGRNHETPWERVKDAIRHAWEHIPG